MASPPPSLTRVALLFVLLSSALSFSAHSASRRDAPAPAVDCSSLVLTMADCLSFVSNGSTVDKPEGTCCSGLKTVLKTDAECLCEAFRSSAQLGVVLNVTKAVTLPAACKVSASSAAKCALSIAPAAAPAEGQTSTPSTSIATAPTGTEVSSEVTPAPAPGKDSSASSRVSVPASLAFLVAAVAGPWFLI